MRTLQLATLAAATISSGLMAGLFFTFANTIMPSLGQSADRTFVEAMYRINVVIQNPLFLLCFMGGLLLSGAAVVLYWRSPALPWVIAGFVGYLAMFLITMVFNIPLNDQLDATGGPDKITDFAAVRSAFENNWVAWNIARSVANVLGFGFLVWAIVVQAKTAAVPAAQPAPPVAAWTR